MGEIDLEVKSNYFKLEVEESHEGIRVYKFVQTYDMSMWPDVSRTLLGTVAILADAIKYVVTLVVILESPCQNTLAVINPNPTDCEVRITPQDTLEVVLFDPKLEFADKWQCHINVDASNSLILERIDQEIMRPNLLKHDRAVRRSFDNVSQEWHMWFQYSSQTKLAMTTLKPGLYPGGNIHFYVDGANDYFHHGVNVGIHIPKEKEIIRPIKEFKELEEEKVGSKPRKVSGVTEIVRRSVCHWDDDEWPTVLNQNYQQYNYHHHYQSPQIREITLREKADRSLDGGCHVLYCENSAISAVRSRHE